MAKSTFLQFFQNVLKFAVVIGTFFLFGYLELQYKCGFVVTILVGLYLFRTGSKIVPTLLVVGNIAASYYSVKALVVLTFLVLNCALLFSERKAADDTKVVLRPYESEVRSILFKHEPALLHTVDSMLDEHEGREKELIYKLNQQYGETTPRKSPSKSSKKSELNPASAVLPIDTSFKSPEIGQKNSEGNLFRNVSIKSPSVISANSPNASYATTVLKIKNILRTKDPALFKSVDRMLVEYQGREGELLQEVQHEYQCEGTGAVYDSAEPFYEPSPSFQSPQYQQQQQQPQQSQNYQQQQSSFVSESEHDYPSQEYRTLDGRPPAARVSLERASLGSPYTWRTESQEPTPVDLRSVASQMHTDSQRLPPFSPTARVVSYNASPRHHAGASNFNSSHTTSGRSAYQEELSQAPFAGNNTPRTTSAQQAYRNSVVHQAQEDARREMQARIDARWGPKPAATGASTSGGSVQKRHGYSLDNNN